MTTKSVKKGGMSRKAARPSVQNRARAIVADTEGYDAETRNAIKNSLDDGDADLAELVRRVEAGEAILDVSAVAESCDRAAHLVASLYDRGAGVPDWLTDLILRGLEAASEKTGVEHYGERDFDLRGLADLFAVTASPKFELEFEPKKDLPELISAVLRHPDTPANLYNAIGDAVSDWHMDDTDPVYLRLALANLAAVQKEIAEDEGGE